MEIVDAYPGPRKHLRWGALQQYLTALLIIVAKLSILDVCGGPGYTPGNSATGEECNKRRMQNENIAT